MVKTITCKSRKNLIFQNYEQYVCDKKNFQVVIVNRITNHIFIILFIRATNNELIVNLFGNYYKITKFTTLTYMN